MAVPNSKVAALRMFRATLIPHLSALPARRLAGSATKSAIGDLAFIVFSFFQGCFIDTAIRGTGTLARTSHPPGVAWGR
jgi:hypothetical protein